MTDVVVMAIFGGFATAIGLVLGSFSNVAIRRIPGGESLWWPASHCPRCHTPIRKADNIPVVSYLWLGGACRSCGAAIPRSYPLVEALVGLLGLLLFWRIFEGEVTRIDLPHWVAWFSQMTFLTLLVIAAYTDIRHWIIPDEASSYAVPVGVASAALLGWLGYDGPLAIDWRQSVISSLVFAGFFTTVSLGAFVITRREALGWGDVKLMAMIGSFLGFMTWVTLVIATIAGVVVHLVFAIYTGRRGYLPFGPSLAAAAIITVLFGHVIVEYFLPGMGMMFDMWDPGS